MATGGNFETTVVGSADDNEESQQNASADGDTSIVIKYKCTPCALGDNIQKAFHYCPECDEFYCEQCLRFHSRMARLKHHKVYGISDADKWGKNISCKQLTEKCPKHTTETINMVCCADNELCCPVCISFDHNTCYKKEYIPSVANGITKSEKLKRVKSKLKYACKSAKEYKSKNEGLAYDLDFKQTSFLQQIADMRKQVNDVFDEMEERATLGITHFANTLHVNLREEIDVCEELNKEMDQFALKLENEDDKDECQVFIDIVRAENFVKQAEGKLEDLQAGKEIATIPDGFTFNSNNDLHQKLQEIKTFGEVSCRYNMKCTCTHTQDSLNHLDCCVEGMVQHLDCCVEGMVQHLDCCVEGMVQLEDCCVEGMVQLEDCCVEGMVQLEDCCVEGMVQLEDCCVEGMVQLEDCCVEGMVQLEDCCVEGMVQLEDCCVEGMVQLEDCCVEGMVQLEDCCVEGMVQLEDCCVEGMVQLEDCSYVLADSSHFYLKWLSQTYTVKGKAELEEPPSAVCIIGAKQIAVSLKNKLAVFQIDGGITPLHHLGLTFSHPCRGLAYSKQKYYITDYNATVYIYKKTGNCIKKIHTNRSFSLFESVRNIAIGEETNKVYVTDVDKGLITLDMNGHEISRLETKETTGAYGVCVTNDGRVLVSNYIQDNVIEVDKDGKNVLQKNLITLPSGQSPRSVCYDRQNSCLLVSENHFGGLGYLSMFPL